MAHLNLTPLLRKRLAPYPRTLGRYNSSELFGISKGWTTPEKWIQQTPFNVTALMAMWNGMIVHDYVQDLLPSECNEVKKVYSHEYAPGQTIELVAKVDHLPNDPFEVWEFKSSKEEHKSAKPGHKYQAKLYCTVHERPLARVFQPVQNERGLFLKEIGVEERDDKWFLEQMDMLSEFHKQVVHIVNTQYGGQLPELNSSI